MRVVYTPVNAANVSSRTSWRRRLIWLQAQN